MIYKIEYQPAFNQYRCLYKNSIIVIDMNYLHHMNTHECPEYIIEHFYDKISDENKSLYFEIEEYDD